MMFKQFYPVINVKGIDKTMMFKDKVCVITGGSLGIGRCLTREFIKEGAKVAFIDSNEKAAQENVRFINQNGGEALFYKGDIAVENDLCSFKDAVIKNLRKSIILLIMLVLVEKVFYHRVALRILIMY